MTENLVLVPLGNRLCSSARFACNSAIRALCASMSSMPAALRTRTMPSRPGTRNRLKTTLPVRYGQDFVTLLDGRCRLSRTVRERLQALVSDLGGEDALSRAVRHGLIRRCAVARWIPGVTRQRFRGGGRRPRRNLCTVEPVPGLDSLPRERLGPPCIHPVTTIQIYLASSAAGPAGGRCHKRGAPWGASLGGGAATCDLTERIEHCAGSRRETGYRTAR